jgi:AraC-like DNA-binding protein
LIAASKPAWTIATSSALLPVGCRTTRIWRGRRRARRSRWRTRRVPISFSLTPLRPPPVATAPRPSGMWRISSVTARCWPPLRWPAVSWAGWSTVQSWHASQLDARRGVVLDVVDTPQPVRRALIFIDEHAGDLITLNEIALAARLSPRGLQAAFRRHLDTMPLAYLRSVRMKRAHRDLQSTDPDTDMSVATSVAGWGLTHLGGFAIAYRRRFGRSPSETLRS